MDSYTIVIGNPRDHVVQIMFRSDAYRDETRRIAAFVREEARWKFYSQNRDKFENGDRWCSYEEEEAKLSEIELPALEGLVDTLDGKTKADLLRIIERKKSDTENSGL